MVWRVRKILSSKKSADIKETPMKMDSLKDVLPVYEEFSTKCFCRRVDCFYRHAKKQFDDDNGQSVEVIEKRMVALFQNIWMTSYTQKLTICILGAVRACIEACKRSESPNERLVHFYDWHLRGHSLPVSIINHTLSVKESEVDIRHSLIQIIIDEIPLTSESRNELYYACARIGCNDLFDYISSASLSSLGNLQVSAPPDTKETTAEKTHVEIGQGLQTGIVEDIKVEPTSDGWQLTGFVPDMLQRLHSNMPVRKDFVAHGSIWHMSIAATNGPSGRIAVRAFIVGLEPSEPVTLSGDFSVTLEPHGSPNQSTTMPMGISVKLDEYNGTSHTWRFYKRHTKKIFQVINKDGRCYFKLRIVMN